MWVSVALAVHMNQTSQPDCQLIAEFETDKTGLNWLWRRVMVMEEEMLGRECVERFCKQYCFYVSIVDSFLDSFVILNRVLWALVSGPAFRPVLP